MAIEIVTATNAEYGQLVQLDHHVPPEVIARKIAMGEILVARAGGDVIGWLRYGYFWDSIPFMNMLVVQEPYRGRGIGAQLVTAWEQAMRAQGYTEVLTSTLANEQAQFFYRKLGYQDCGALLLPGEPLEILMRKALGVSVGKVALQEPVGGQVEHDRQDEYGAFDDQLVARGDAEQVHAVEEHADD